MKTLPIVWKRLLKDGQTCNRCGNTLQQLEAALAKLQAALQPLGIEPTLQAQSIDENAFKAEPAESNRIWIAGRPMEEWLGAQVGMSRCCSVCGDSDCRTLEVGGQRYETIPEELVIKAALLAASQGFASTTPAHAQAASCCASTCGCKS